MEDSRFERKDWEYEACVRDILEHPVFRSMEQYMQHGETSCLEHSLRVSYMSYRICKGLGWNEREAARAGLLHDLFLYDWHTHGRETGERFHGFTHPKKALKNAEQYFNLTDRERDGILRHMWPMTVALPRYRESYAIVLADKVCSAEETAAGAVKRLHMALKKRASGTAGSGGSC